MKQTNPAPPQTKPEVPQKTILLEEDLFGKTSTNLPTSTVQKSTSLFDDPIFSR